jgi:acyl-CoA thioesterase I
MRLLALGDSLTAGYGLPLEAGFTAQLEAGLRAEGIEVRVINGGVSGDTTAGGRARLEWSLADKPDAVLLALGANDALRALPVEDTAANLRAILSRLAMDNIPVLLAGMYAPRNLGQDYVKAFDALYPNLAKEFSIELYPFFLEGVAGMHSLNQADGIHPNAEGVALMVKGLLPQVKNLLTAQKRPPYQP